MINKKDDLIQFIREASQELYAEPGEEPLLVKDAQSSVDNQIDAFLIKFEENSQLDPGWDKEMEDVLSESLLNLSLKFLMEQPGGDVVDLGDDEEEEEEEDPVAEDPEDKGADVPDPVGSESLGPEEGKEPPKLPINVDEFAKRVARLAMNSEILLDVQTVVINRALRYLAKEYDEEHARKMLSVLEDEFDFDLEDDKDSKEAPYAVGAWAGGTGGGGGVA
jgi:hypothetical protein